MDRDRRPPRFRACDESHLGVPHDRELGLVTSRCRALGLLVVLGGGLLVTTALSGASAAGGSLGVAVRIGAGCISLAANFLLFWLAFRLLTPGSIPWACFVQGSCRGRSRLRGAPGCRLLSLNHVVRNPRTPTEPSLSSSACSRGSTCSRRCAVRGRNRRHRDPAPVATAAPGRKRHQRRVAAAPSTCVPPAALPPPRRRRPRPPAAKTRPTR